jgi:hypothetical protein
MNKNMMLMLAVVAGWWLFINKNAAGQTGWQSMRGQNPAGYEQ